MGKSDFLPKPLPKFSVGQNLILNIIKLLEMSTSFFFSSQHLIMKLNSGHAISALFSFTLWPTRLLAILIRSHTARNLHASHFLWDTGFMEQYGWKIWPGCTSGATGAHSSASNGEGCLSLSRKRPIPDITVSLVSGTQSEQSWQHPVEWFGSAEWLGSKRRKWNKYINKTSENMTTQHPQCN